ncbi:hypothetical protein E4T56_gene16458, partial [Termitomyces sp. T112]
LKMAYNFGGATLTSITSGNWRDLSRVDDYTQVAAYNIFGAGKTAAFIAANPNFGSPQSTATKQTLFTQEIRLTTNDQTAPIYGTVGVFLSTSKQSLLQVEWGDANASYPAAVYFLQGGALVPGNAFNYNVSSGPFPAGGILASKYQVEIDRQASAFADATWNVTSKLKFNAGVRVARQSYSFQYIGNGYFQGGVQILPLTSTKSTPINPKFNISWQTNPNLLLYATAAKGNRAGGANRPIPAARCAADIAQNGSIPQTYGDDSVWSFEGGMKGRFMGGKLSVSGSGFYLKWHNVQQNLSLSNCSFSYVGNFGDATSKGFDLSVSARPTTWATISGNVGYTKATLDQNVTGTANATTGIAPVLATKGSALSFVPDWTADVALDLNHPLPWYGLNGSLRVDYQYAGQYTRTPALGSTLYNAINFQGDAYELVNLRAGVARDAWTFSVFAKNLTNAYPTLYKSSQSGAANIFLMTSTLAPRTGVSASFLSAAKGGQQKRARGTYPARPFVMLRRLRLARNQRDEAVNALRIIAQPQVFIRGMLIVVQIDQRQDHHRSLQFLDQRLGRDAAAHQRDHHRITAETVFQAPDQPAPHRLRRIGEQSLGKAAALDRGQQGKARAVLCRGGAVDQVEAHGLGLRADQRKFM